MRIKVISYNGLPPVQPISAEISERGGSIGRDDSNTLVLPDLAKHISRLHAAITFRGGNFVIQDRGTVTPVYVNGQELGNGQEAVIVAGDEIAIGGFKLRVLDGNAPSGNLDQSYAPPRPPAATESPKDDPLAMFGTSSTTVNPFADLLAPATSYKQAKDDTAPLKSAFAKSATTSSSSIIPLDFDPFADFKPAEPLVQPNPPVRPVVKEDQGLVMSTAAPSIDELFGLGSSAGRDPFALGNPLAEPLHQPVVAHSVDPLVALDAAAAGKVARGAPPINDAPKLSSEARTSEKKLGDTVRMFHAPVRPEKPASLSPQAQGSTSALQPSGMILSWESTESNAGDGEIKSVVVPSPKPDRGEQTQAEVQSQQSSAVKAVVVEDKPVVSAAEAASHNELLQAFLAGAGVPNLALPGKLTPEMMNTFGQLLREATQGTLDLLLARALTKQEVRADATMIVGKENNPLKFSPSVEVALSHLLAPQGYGFMQPKQSMKDAYNDLRSHQFGFMAGMRAALTGVLERFNPGRLEQRLTQKKLIDSILPMQRKAKLWDLFAELYGDISKEAEEDFHELFGKAFLRAYEEQIDKLRQEDKPRKS